MTWLVTVDAELVNRNGHETLRRYIVNVTVRDAWSRANAMSRACAYVRDNQSGNLDAFVRARATSASIIRR